MSKYSNRFANLTIEIKNNLGNSNTKYDKSQWDVFIEVLHDVIEAFEKQKKHEYALEKKRVENKPSQTALNKAQNKKVDADVKKVEKLIAFISDRKQELYSDPDYLLGFASISKSEEPQKVAHVFVNKLTINLQILAKVLNSKRTNAFKNNVPKPTSKRPYATKSLRETLIICLLIITHKHLNISPKKSSDIKGFNAVATPVLVYVAEAATKYSSHNYQEMYASSIDFYKEHEALYLDCVGENIDRGYILFNELL